VVLQALGRTHRIGQSRFQRVWTITQDHSYDQLSQAAQTKEMLQQIAGEGLIELDDADFEINDVQIADETAEIIEDEERRQRADELRGEALLRKGHAIRVQSEGIIARMMSQPKGSQARGHSQTVSSRARKGEDCIFVRSLADVSESQPFRGAPHSRGDLRGRGTGPAVARRAGGDSTGGGARERSKY
jgi:hypothetical protein